MFKKTFLKLLNLLICLLFDSSHVFSIICSYGI